MRKLVIISFIFIIATFIVPSKAVSESHDFHVIPDDAIRLRILAHSDLQKDQEVKELVRDVVSDQITTWVEHMTDIDEARQLIESRIPQLSEVVDELFQENSIHESFEMDYQSNVTFPAKLYDSVIYPAGEYEAVLITIGNGEGSNWWCVLFPPLCFLDFGQGTTIADGAENENVEEKSGKKVKVKFFLFEWLGWT